MFITLKTFALEGALASLSTSLQRLKIKIPALFKTSSQFDLFSFSSPSKVKFEGLSFNLHYVGSQGFRADNSKHRYANNVINLLNKSTLSSEYQNQQQTAVPNLIGRSTRL